jgi:amino acid adenylation domain-containing protein
MFRDERLTYSELNRRANRLARYLTTAGVGPASRVVVCLEPAAEVIVALLAILKAGGVYVPLDPTYPPARLRTILSEAQPQLAIVQSQRTAQIAGEGRIATFSVDTEEHRLQGLSEENLSLSIAPEETASIYYTSGTTGVPKGVMASYANLAHYLEVAQTRYRFSDRDVVPAIARFSFSISMFELLLPLAAGGTLILLEREHVLDLARMSRTLSEVTFFHAGPALLKNVLPYIQRHDDLSGAFSRVRHASSGGDMVPVEVQEALKDVFVNAEVFVIYGCTEISCMGCTYPVPRGAAPVRGNVGWPFDDMALRIVDDALNVVPPGVAGEVLFAGSGVVKGYLNQPQTTAEKFVDLDGRRFYRTGDIGRIHEDGSLELIGRIDFQVKVRGMRVELGEIEHHLRRAPGVRDGVVVARDTPNGEKVLVAYVVLSDGEATAERGAAARLLPIRRCLAQSLPDYMVPARYVELSALPLNVNMKLDRRALPPPPREEAPDARRAADSAGGQYAQDAETPTEKCLASLWKKLLQVDHVAVDDRFFDLGGDSMLALTLILEVDRELGVTLEGLEVLHEPLGVLAAICDRRLGKPVRTPRVRARTEFTGEVIQPFHFGPGESLYGVLHRSTTAPRNAAALLCSPVGPESARTQFILQRLAHLLTAEGMPVLRFDYYGTGDSLGEGVEATCARWQADIADATSELRRRTKAAKIAAIGVRFGGTLLWNTAKDLDLATLVFWDPVGDGAEYCAELAEGHRKYVGSVRHLRFWTRAAPVARASDREELLGFAYSRKALSEMKALAMSPIANLAATPVQWVATWRHARQNALFRSIAREWNRSRIETLDFECCWNDVSRAEHTLPDAGIAKKLAAMLKEVA